jgi:hypothetical protein
MFSSTFSAVSSNCVSMNADTAIAIRMTRRSENSASWAVTGLPEANLAARVHLEGEGHAVFRHGPALRPARHKIWVGVGRVEAHQRLIDLLGWPCTPPTSLTSPGSSVMTSSIASATTSVLAGVAAKLAPVSGHDRSQCNGCERLEQAHGSLPG